MSNFGSGFFGVLFNPPHSDGRQVVDAGLRSANSSVRTQQQQQITAERIREEVHGQETAVLHESRRVSRNDFEATDNNGVMEDDRIDEEALEAHNTDECMDADEELQEEEEEYEDEEELDLTTATIEQLMQCTVEELRGFLHERKLTVSGRKKDLADRLLQWARNLNKEEQEDQEEEEQEEEEEQVDLSQVPEVSESLSVSLSANRYAADMNILNERLNDILENEYVKDEETIRIQNELRKLSEKHKQDLSELGFAKDLVAVDRKFTTIVDELHQTSEREETRIHNLESSIDQLKEEADQGVTTSSDLKRQLEILVKEGDDLDEKIQKLAEKMSKTIVKKRTNYSTRIITATRTKLFEVALDNIEDEKAKHDPQREMIIKKLDHHIAELKNDNDQQIHSMHHYSDDIINEAKELLQTSYNSKVATLEDTYSSLRELLQSQSIGGEDKISQHREYLESQCKAHVSECTLELSAQVQEAQEAASRLEEEKVEVESLVNELLEHKREQEAELAEVQKETKELNSQTDQVTEELRRLKDQFFVAQSDLDLSEHKFEEMDKSYNILMSENSHLISEIQRYESLVNNAEKNLSSIDDEVITEEQTFITPKASNASTKRRNSRRTSSTTSKKRTRS